MEVGWRQAIDGAKGHDRHLETNALSNSQPVETDKRVGDVVRPPDVENEPSGGVLNRLEPAKAGRRQTEQNAVAVVQPRQH